MKKSKSAEKISVSFTNRQMFVHEREQFQDSRAEMQKDRAIEDGTVILVCKRVSNKMIKIAEAIYYLTAKLVAK